MAKGNGGRLKKAFSVFDCDAHVNDHPDIWTKYVEPQYRELVRQAYWRDETGGLLNGEQRVLGGAEAEFPTYNPICIAGPGMNKKLMRRLQQMPLTPEQKDYLLHKGAYDPHERLKDMDLMGIDQVLVIPTMLCEHFLRIQNHDAAYALARAYNNWARDWCDKVPDRLFPAGLIPIQDTRFAMQELHRIAKLKFPVALVRPVEGAPGQYPNRIFPSVTATTMDFMDPLFRTFEETQVVLGMHTFPAPAGGIGSGPLAYSPGEFLTQAGNGTNRRVDSQTLSFVFEAMAWTAQVLLSGFLDRYPKLKMAIYESNSTWFPEIMERCDKLFKLYANERMQPAQRLPSEAFYQQGIIAFESDEVPVFRQWDKFENIGIWSSDAYHHDGADSWSAMREMEDVEVPHDVQAKLLGGNARRFYGVEGKMFVTEEPTSIPRPAWFPKEDEEFSKWWDREVYPRKHGRTTATHGHLAAVRGY